MIGSNSRIILWTRSYLDGKYIVVFQNIFSVGHFDQVESTPNPEDTDGKMIIESMDQSLKVVFARLRIFEPFFLPLCIFYGNKADIIGLF